MRNDLGKPRFLALEIDCLESLSMVVHYGQYCGFVVSKSSC